MASPLLLIALLVQASIIVHACSIIEGAGAKILEEYVTIFGIPGTDVEMLGDSPALGRAAMLHKSKLEREDFAKNHIVCQSSPLYALERHTLSTWSWYPQYEITEEVGRMHFPNLDAAQNTLDTHINTLAEKLKDHSNGTFNDESEEIDIVLDLDVINVESVDRKGDNQQKAAERAARIANWTLDLNLEVFRVELMRHFILQHPCQFITPPVDASLSHGYFHARKAATQKTESAALISLVDQFGGKFPEGLGTSSSASHILPKFRHWAVETGNQVFDSLAKLLPKPTVQICHLPSLLYAEGLVTTRKVELNGFAGWLSLAEVFQGLNEGQVKFIQLHTEYTVSKIPPSRLIQGEIVQMTLSDFQSWTSKTFEATLLGMQHINSVINRHALIVNAAGDMSLVQSSNRGDLACFLAERAAACFINVVGLCLDGAHLTAYTNQPGSGPLARRTLAAISHGGNTFSTGNAASVISFFAVMIKKRFPGLDWEAIAGCLLESATPIVLVTTRSSAPFSKPIILEGIMAKDFKAGIVVGLDEDRLSARLVISQQMFMESRRKYGMGRVNLKHALQLAYKASKQGEKGSFI